MAASTVTSIFLRRSVQSAAPRAHLLARKTLAAPALRCTAQRFRGFSSGVAAQAKKYTHEHEWIELSEDGETGSIGISTYAAHALGDVVFVELPTVDLEVSAGDSIGAVESVKSASDIMTPVSGTIVEANSVLEDSPSTINKSPEGDGWLAKIKVADKTEIDSLMDEAAYKAFTEESEDH